MAQNRNHSKAQQKKTQNKAGSNNHAPNQYRKHPQQINEAEKRRRAEARRKKREKQARKRARRAAREKALHASMLNQIPDNYIDFFPDARKMHRRFVLHIGPTNSGKTYEAIQALKEAGDGIYLAPLRLLAYEKFEQMNTEGYPCSLVTGEERYLMDRACYQASTIEMLNLKKHYSCAVIDEAQMVADDERGGSWTSAILGVCANEIHVCMAQNAEQLIIRMIEECGDTYEIVRHERKTPLICEKEKFYLPDNVMPGDALIVFSKKNVHEVASELQGKGYKCSVIYGALPYDVRHEQARLFAEGINDVVVATDAIGMGLNLPIRRVCFLEMAKFDGKDVRDLTSEEIKQIAGRAGRFGIYDEGYVTSLLLRSRVQEALEEPSESLAYATVGFPESLLGLNAPLLDILRRWSQVNMNVGYKRADTERMIKLCKEIRDISENKTFLYDCLTVTFDEGNPWLFRVWKEMCRFEAEEECYPVGKRIPSEHFIKRIREDLDDLEQQFKLCDLLYSYCDKFDHDEFVEEIIRRKNMISDEIIRVLAKQKLKPRTCKYCGKVIPWNYRYGVCERCFKKIRGMD